MSKQKVKVPDSLRDVLLEFSIAYLLEQPGDVIDFAVDYFSKLQTNRAQTGGFVFKKPSTPDDSIVSQDEGELLMGMVVVGWEGKRKIEEK
jgi:cAMP-dependent protein kinase regulator